MGDGPNDAGLSRHHLIASCEASLRRLGVDHVDLYQVHEWDGVTPVEETLHALDTLVASGKVRYVGCSNFAGWQMTKSLGVSDRLGLQRYVSQQVYYSLQSRDAEYEIIPAAVDQGVGILVWSPLAGGLLSGKYRRGEQGPAGARQLTDWDEPPVRDEAQLYDVVDALVEIAAEHDASAAQVALAWLLGRAGDRVGARRRADGGAAHGQPPRGGPRARRGRARAARRAQRAAAALSLLAPGQDGQGPPRPGRPHAARPAHLTCAGGLAVRVP